MPKKIPLRGTAAPHPPFVSLKFVIGSEDISGKPSRRDKAVFVGGEGQPLVRLCGLTRERIPSNISPILG